MRNKIYTLTAILTIAIFYYFSISAFKKESGSIKTENTKLMTSLSRDTFTNCIFNGSFTLVNAWEYPDSLHVTKILDKYKELNFNAVHQYDEIGSENYGWADTLELKSYQIDNYRDFLDSVKNQGNLCGFFERSFLSKYCYGQRLIYEVPEHQNDETTNYGFVYSNSECGSHDIDQGRTVIHADPNIHESGNICYDIFENLQHTDLFNFRQNDTGTWYIKPVMRIPTGMPDDVPVIRIDVFAFDSTLVNQIIIETDNFYDTGNYQGNYLEKYFKIYPPLSIPGKDSLASLNKGRGNESWLDWNTTCHIDFRVYWYGQCEVWFDKMIVDDGIANDLFNPNKQIEINSRINQEVSNFTHHLYTFFTDEVFISQYPCIKYVVDKMRYYEPSSRLSLAVTHNGDILGLKNDNLGYKIYLDSIKPDFIQDDHHGIQVGIPFGILKIPPTVPIIDSMIPSTWIASSNDAYNLQLQDTTIGGKNDGSRTNYVGSLIYELRKVKEAINESASGTKFIMQPQIHGWLSRDTTGPFYKMGSREPLNEEIQVQAMVSIAHGTNGLCWFAYNSYNGTQYQLGLVDPYNNISRRTRNCYGQNKWQYVSNMNGKILNWAPTLENSNWVEGFSVHQNTANYEFIEDIKSIYRMPTNPFDFIDNNTDAVKYWEMGFFNPKDQSDKSKYLLMVNRRCVPESYPGIGNIRMLKIKFNQSELSGFNNWIIKDVYTGHEITFNKNNQGTDGFLYLGSDTGDIGYFNPGEGKLFKLAPVMQEGGTLVCNEEVGIISFECKANVNNAGYDITINPRTDIQFHLGVEINMRGGKFICGNIAETSNNVNLTGKNNALWNGLNLINCDSIRISKTNIVNAQNTDPQVSSKYAINLINCSNVSIQNSTIHSYGVGAINSIYTNTSEPGNSVNYIGGNDFILDDFLGYTIRFIQAGYVTLPVRIENNTFTHNNNYTSNCAIFLSGVSAGSIISNYISNYYTGINLMSSSIDLFGNTLTSNLLDSKLIHAVSGSTLILGESNTSYTGGCNLLNSTADTSYNILLDNSTFFTFKGNNIFKIKEDDPTSFHFAGNIQNVNQQTSIDGSFNCYYAGEGGDTNILLYWSGTNELVNYIIDPTFQECVLSRPSQMEVFASDGGINDTLYFRSGGNGGGEKGEIGEKAEKGEKGEEITSLKSLYGNLCYQTRKRNYDSIIFNAVQIIDLYPDSLKSLDAVSKLYFASLKKDSAGNKINPLKTYFEALILNNPNNAALISKSFYLIQKCKVSLKQYTSALAGFQQIIQQNPYSYEALLASWDYAATSLLMNGGGSGGVKNLILNIKNKKSEEDNINIDGENEILNLEIYLDNFMNNYDSTKFGKSDRVKLADITKKTFENKKKDEIKQIEILQTRSSKGDREAQKELYKKKTINEVAKANKPKSYDEYVRIINNNIDKIFTNPKLKSNKEILNIIPKEFSLYQNYPNPFNPVTKISFDLPKDAKVKLIVYDILGREVSRLLNSEFRQAGKHIIDFDAMKYNLASGVYFYRIEAGDYNAVKKMLMIK